MVYAAHITKDGRVQTVEEHCRNTAALCARYAKRFGLEHIAWIAGLLHDLGKFICDFNGYIRGENGMTRGQIDHSFAGARLITEFAARSQIKLARETAQLIAHVIVSHHGLHDWVDINGGDYLSERLSHSDRWDEICANARQLISDEELAERLAKAAEEYAAALAKIRAITEGDDNAVKKRAFYMGMLERLAESCLIDADRTDTADFTDGVQTVERDPAPLWEEMQGRMESRLGEFTDDSRISALRRDISDRCAQFAEHRVGAVRLVVPTGGGKTLSSLRFAVEYCRRFGMERIVYTAPFMSILEQNSAEFKKIAGAENFLEHHSDIFSRIEDDGELADRELACERWTSPVIATTLVQFLNALFLGRTSAVRRFHRLGRAVVIIDEVQSLPLKCVYIFSLAVNFLTKVMGCAVVLCSATQPRLEQGGCAVIMDEQSSMTGDYTEDFEAFRRTRAVPLLKNGGYDYDEAAHICMERFRENGDLLVIVNTRRSAAEMFSRLRELNEREPVRAEASHISTRLCPEHRRAEIARLRGLLDEKKPVICVTTQLIEAGVDISFRCVVRALAGLDSAAQAAGRCNRHGEDECRSVYIMELGGERLDRLPEIAHGKSCAGTVCVYGGHEDVLSPAAVTDYFGRYYREMAGELPYSCKDGSADSTLLDMLSLNENRGNKSAATKYTGQAFATAGRIFRAIDSAAQAVIVPYNDEAREIIARLNGELSPQEGQRLARQAQRYAVNVFEGELRGLTESGAVYELRSGALALCEGYYDKQLGMTADGRPQDYIF